MAREFHIQSVVTMGCTVTIPNLPTQIPMHAHFPGCAIGPAKMSNFTAPGHHGLSGVHVVHHSTNTDACTPPGGGMSLVVTERCVFSMVKKMSYGLYDIYINR